MSNVPQLTLAELAADSTVARVIDAREPAEFAGDAIAGSADIPLGQLPARLGELDGATPMVAACQSGRRSSLAAEQLAGPGFTVANLEGGMSRWTAEGRQIALPVSRFRRYIPLPGTVQRSLPCKSTSSRPPASATAAT
jgi:rhodanese-related sulfurtransferase